MTRAGRRAERDAGYLTVIEAFLFATIFLTAASYVTFAARPATEQGAPGATVRVEDALVAWSASQLAGASAVDALAAHAWTCAATAAGDGCVAEGGAGARARFESYLPPGMHYELTWSNGVRPVPLGPTRAWEGPSTSSSILHIPEWTRGIAVPTLSCVEVGQPVDVEATLVTNGNPHRARELTLQGSGAAVAGVVTSGVWRGAAAPASGTGIVEAGAAGAVAVPTCLPAGTSGSLRTAASATSIRIEDETRWPQPGTRVRIAHNVTALAALDRVTLTGVEIDIHAPTPGNASTPTWTLRAEGDAGATEWTVPETALLGCHTIVLRTAFVLDADAAAVPLASHRVAHACIGLPTGHLPPDPVYRVDARAWMPDWGMAP